MKIGNAITEYFRLRKAYRELSRLDDASLKDIGVPRSQIRQAVFGR